MTHPAPAAGHSPDASRTVADAALHGDLPPPRILLPVLMLAAFGIYLAALTPLNVALAIRIADVDPTGKTASLSTVVLVGALVSIASLPLLGALTDRSRSRFGRRRPWLVGGVVAALVGLVIAGSVPSVTGVAVGWVIASLGLSAAESAFLPLISEFVPDHLRAKLSGLIGFVVALAVVIGVFLGSRLAAQPLLMFALPGVVALLGVITLAAVMRKADRPLHVSWPRFRLREFIGSYWLRTGGDRDFAWNCLSRFLVGSALVGTTTYPTYFLTDTVGLGIEAAAAEYARVLAIATPVAIVSFLLSGYLSDRLRRRKAFVCVAAMVMGAALVIAAVTQSVSGFLIAWLVLNIGLAVYLTVDIAIAAAVVPDEANAGKAMSIYLVAARVPHVGTPILAVAVLTLSGHSNYPAFFVVLAALVMLAGVVVLFIRRIR